MTTTQTLAGAATSTLLPCIMPVPAIYNPPPTPTPTLASPFPPTKIQPDPQRIAEASGAILVFKVLSLASKPAQATKNSDDSAIPPAKEGTALSNGARRCSLCPLRLKLLTYLCSHSEGDSPSEPESNSRASPTFGLEGL